MRPQSYSLELRLDPERSQRFQGEVEIELELDKKVRSIELHAVELRVGSARLWWQGGSTRARVRVIAAHETVRIELGREVPKGKARLQLGFAGKLRRDLRGLYAAASGKHRYAFSQLEATDARRFFPCFDEPSMKARFTLAVTTASKHFVVSNSPIASRRRLSGGLQRTLFRQTPLLSTYLVALGVGALEASEPIYSGKVPIRILHVPGQGHLTSFALRAAKQCLERLSRYFALPYPYEKLDLVAVPDFEMGAMENAGAVFFRETLLLLDARKASLAEEKRALEVICHELAHMWFGNLVTMAFWDDLWLNEAFATWIAFDVVAALRPDLRMWNDFGHSRASALELDALKNTHSVYAKVQSAEEATERFDLITYEKGAAVIRMLERYLGRERFRRGVRHYMRAHREANATASDLWRALELHAGSDISRVVRPWIEREGFPRVSFAIDRHGGGLRARLSQARFSAHGPPQARARSSRPWPVPVVLRIFSGKKKLEHRHLLKSRTGTLKLQKSTLVYGNADEGGFYHPLHDEPGFRALLRNLERLESSERLGLVTHTWALACAGETSLGRMLELMRALGDERDPDVIAALIEPMHRLIDRVAHSDQPLRAKLRKSIAHTFLPALEQLGLGAARPRGMSDADSARRAGLVHLLGTVAEHPEVAERAARIGARYLMEPSRVDPNLSGAALAIFARGADRADHARLLARSLQGATPGERRRFRMVLADARDPRCIERTLALFLSPKIPAQDAGLLLARLFENPAARKTAFDFVASELPRVKRRLPPTLGSRVVEAARALSTDVSPRRVLALFASAALPSSTQALARLREHFALDEQLAARSQELST